MPIDQQELRQSLRALMELRMDLAAAPAMAGRLGDVVLAARDVLRVDDVGLLMLDDEDRPRVVASTGPASRWLEESQLQLGIGPGMDALRMQGAVGVDDLRTDDRYRGLGGSVLDEGVRAVLAVPVRVDGETHGALNLVRSHPHAWTREETAAAGSFADLLASLLLLTPGAAMPHPAAGGAT